MAVRKLDIRTVEDLEVFKESRLHHEKGAGVEEIILGEKEDKRFIFQNNGWLSMFSYEINGPESEYGPEGFVTVFLVTERNDDVERSKGPCVTVLAIEDFYGKLYLKDCLYFKDQSKTVLPSFENRYEAEELQAMNLPMVNDLPDRIDFSKTLAGFARQIVAKDFSDPVLL